MAAALDGLWPENRDAWHLYQRIVSRFTVDCQVLGPLLLRVVDGRDLDDALDVVQRLSLIYQELGPGSAPRPES